MEVVLVFSGVGRCYVSYLVVSWLLLEVCVCVCINMCVHVYVCGYTCLVIGTVVQAVSCTCGYHSEQWVLVNRVRTTGRGEEGHLHGPLVTLGWGVNGK